jgi:replicative DNA helicase
MQQNKKIAIFLKHLWATDGNISWKILKGRKPAAAIYYSSTSKILIHQLQHLLIRFGIQSTIQSVRKESYRLNHNLHIQGAENQIKFLKHINCYGERGNITPLLIKALEKIAPNHNLDIIPKEAWELFVAKAKAELNIGWRNVSAGLQIAYNGTALFKSGIGRARMIRLAAVLKNNSLGQLAHSDIYWDEITSIKSLGKEEVYDATVSENHNFIANDILVHNSIEQDSDVVMFIHRDDKINHERAKDQNKLNLANLIVAKHRNGPTGEVEFRIEPDSLRFVEVDKTHSEPIGF